MQKFMIVNANFNNKGAQSMLITTISAIRRFFPDASIYFANTYGENADNYKVISVPYSYDAQMISLGGAQSIRSCIRSVLKALHKGFKKNVGAFQEFDIKKLFPDLTAIFDVSGFNLGDKWSVDIHKRYFNNIKLAKKYSIPMYLMPQSFGPFCYSDDKKYLMEDMQKLLPYPKVIFAREKEGKRLLEETFGLQNVILSTDLVLQNSSLQLDSVFYKMPELNLPIITEKHNVGIIPNKQCFNFEDRENILGIYERIIDMLLSNGKNIYIFRHSSEDLEFCNMIKEGFPENDKVTVLDNDFSCLEYDVFVRQFDFIVCSRFHGIVHAYRNGVPCIALGWAVKYKELAENVSQGQYVLNIADESVSIDRLDAMLSDMLKNHIAESEIIKKKITEIQRSNCFSILEELR